MPFNEPLVTVSQRLGRLPRKSTRHALLFSDFFTFVDLPKASNHWARRQPIPQQTFGNTEHGCCTRAKQAVAAMRMERLEQKRTIQISDDEVIRIYYAMTQRLYGGGDTGAYEVDALNEWRNPDLTFRDLDGRPYTIDAYLGINASNHRELRAGLALAKAQGIAVCLNLPAAFSTIQPPLPWGIPGGQALTGEWMPGSWGGHSMHAFDYTDKGILLDHTWGFEPQLLTWDAAAAYLDEAHLIIDSVNSWRKKASPKVKKALGDVVDAVNALSSVQIEV